jgi:hypothetical protein
MAGPFAIGSPWAAGIEDRLVGQDTVKVSAVGVNTLTGTEVRCPIGAANRPGQLPRVEGLWAVGEGRFVFSAILRLEPLGPEIAVCERDGNVNILAHGDGIETGSVVVSGTLVKWTQEGRPKSARL